MSLDFIRGVIADIIDEENKDSITEELSIIDDLMLEPEQIEEMFETIENELNIDLSDEHLDDIDLVKDIVRITEEHS